MRSIGFRRNLVDEIALKEALDEHIIAGAASDVFQVEPLSKDNPLFWKFNFALWVIELIVVLRDKE